MPDVAAYADFSIKARCANLEEIEKRLNELGARFAGEDNQTDTYFRVPTGKMKLRDGNIENLLTHYLREEQAGKMKTTVFLYERNPTDDVKRKYTGSLEVIGKVVKRRKIFFIDNVKFHVDRFEDGGKFIEIEAIDRDGTLGIDTISTQAGYYKKLFSIADSDILKDSYIDMK